MHLAPVKFILSQPISALRTSLSHEDNMDLDSCLGDTVFIIRASGTIKLKKLTEVFGVDWPKVQIVPKVMGMGQHPRSQ